SPRWDTQGVSAHRPIAVLFDAGGTLILQDPEEMSARLGRPIDAMAAHRAHYVAMAEFSDRRLQGHALDWDWWLERYFGLLGVADPHLAGERIAHGYGVWNHSLDGVAEAIEAMLRSGIRVAVVSNSDGSVTESLARAGLAPLFGVVIEPPTARGCKPDPPVFE